jgi:hypothetical protein
MDAVTQQESGGNGTAVSNKGALGSTQLEPGTAKEMAARAGLPFRPDMLRSNDPAALNYQRRLGLEYLKQGYEQTGNLADALRYYHGGPNRAMWGPKTEAYAANVFSRLALHNGEASAPTQLSSGQYDTSDWEKRPDGTTKGTGFLGVYSRPDGTVSSEISVGLPINGKEMDVPTMVPGLTPQELNWLLTTPVARVAKELPDSIRQKAIAHAKARIAAGLSPFKQANE